MNKVCVVLSLAAALLSAGAAAGGEIMLIEQGEILPQQYDDNIQSFGTTSFVFVYSPGDSEFAFGFEDSTDLIALFIQESQVQRLLQAIDTWLEWQNHASRLQVELQRPVATVHFDYAVWEEKNGGVHVSFDTDRFRMHVSSRSPSLHQCVWEIPELTDFRDARNTKPVESLYFDKRDMLLIKSALTPGYIDNKAAEQLGGK
jgi:hypothetical protein